MQNENIMRFKGMGDQELVELFEKAFTEQVSSKCNIEEFSVHLARSVDSDYLRFEVEITGLAGAPTMEDFKLNKLKDAAEVKLSRADKGNITLKLAPLQTVFLTGNDYLITYSN